MPAPWAVLPIPLASGVRGARARAQAYGRDPASCVRGCHAITQPLEGMVSPLLLYLCPPNQSSPQIWELHANPSVSLQSLVTLVALVVSAQTRPHCSNQLKRGGSDVSVYPGEGAGCGLEWPDGASEELMYGKGSVGLEGVPPGVAGWCPFL